ncbi:hypothetical protein Slin14017_G122400 [Septoria linicola]|nr:hypothetical protein Slin14017_G122400 [Septoria linicola]
MATDYASNRDVQTSMQLLAQQQPGTCFFNLALKKTLCHAVSHQILCQTTGTSSACLDTIRINLRKAGADQSQEQTVVEQLRELASMVLAPLLSDGSGDDVNLASTPKAAQPSQSMSERPSTASPNLTKRGHTLDGASDAADPASKRSKLKQPVLATPRLIAPAAKLRELDLETFASSDLDQRKVLARRAFSLPIELYFHHLRHALPKLAMNYEQASLIWSKLTLPQTEQWEALLAGLHDGNIAAASTAGADLLTEHEILQKLAPPEVQLTETDNTRSTAKDKGSVHKADRSCTRISTRSRVRPNAVKSPFF